MKLLSSAFENGALIPAKYATNNVMGGQNVSIPFSWSQIPAKTKSLALSLVDIHPAANNWLHWLVVGIRPNIENLAEGASGENMPAGAIELPNSYGYLGYGGPQPPPGTGPHKYVAYLYALNASKLDLSPAARLPEFLSAIKKHVLEKTEYLGVFER